MVYGERGAPNKKKRKEKREKEKEGWEEGKYQTLVDSSSEQHDPGTGLGFGGRQ
jgi:hypothetical protein